MLYGVWNAINKTNCYAYIWLFCHVNVFQDSFVYVFRLPIVSRSMIISLILGCLWPLVFVLKQHFDTRYLTICDLSPPRMFLPMDLLPEYRIQHGAIGPLYVTSIIYPLNLDILHESFRLCNWLSLWRLLSWINHLPPACWSTFWKSTFKQQLGCRFDIMDSIS